MKKVNIGITEKNRQAIADQLSKILADEFLIYAKTLNAHWNVEGPDFHAAHIYLETLFHLKNIKRKLNLPSTRVLC